ncbi:hypothetical protein Bca4012_000190 [Brassica carinata]
MRKETVTKLMMKTDDSENKNDDGKDDKGEDNSDELGLCLWLLPYNFIETVMTELKSTEFLSSYFPPPQTCRLTAEAPEFHKALGENCCLWSISVDAL